MDYTIDLNSDETRSTFSKYSHYFFRSELFQNILRYIFAISVEFVEDENSDEDEASEAGSPLEKKGEDQHEGPVSR